MDFLPVFSPAHVEKVQDIYGVDISDIESGKLAQIFARIASSQLQ